MKRLTSIVGLVAVLALAACGGSSSADIASLFPADNEVAGWSEDPADLIPGVAVANNFNEAEALVNGDADPFASAPSPFVAFAWQNYVSGDYKMDFRVWEVADAAGCASMYSYLASEVTTFAGKTWSDEAIGDQGRSAETAVFWWFNACADKYFLEAKVQLVAGGAPDATAHDLGLSFVQAVAANVP